MKKERKKSDKELTLHRILTCSLYLLWGFILLFCTLLLFATTGHCAIANNGELPYNVPDYRGANNVIPTLAIEMARDRAIDTIQNYYGYTGDVSFIMFTNDGIINNYIYDVMVIPMPTINYNIAPTSNFRENAYFVTANYVPMFRVGVLLNFDHTERNLNAGNGSNLLGVSATSELNGETFTPRYPFYMYGLDELSASNGTVIFTNNEPIPVIPVGHATEPDEFDEPLYPTGATIPSHVPNLTINNYTWTTVPTPDFSTLEKTAESIYNFLQWLGSNLMGALTNLVNNLSNIGEFIGQTIQYFCTLIIKTIQNGITNFYNNMVSLFEPIASTINYIGQPFDSTALIDAFESMQIYNDYDRCGQLIDDAFGFFDDISEPNTFTIPIDLRSITILHQNEILYFDLGWINSAKNIIRAFMWTVTTFGLLYTVIDSIPDYLQGQDE